MTWSLLYLYSRFVSVEDYLRVGGKADLVPFSTDGTVTCTLSITLTEPRNTDQPYQRAPYGELGH